MNQHRPDRSARLIVAILVFLVVGLLAYPLSQAAMIPQSVDDLVSNSTHIVRGDVLSTQAQWDPTHSYIYTTVTLNVAKWHMGIPADAGTITLFVPGGEVGSTGLRVEHAPQFEPGEDVIVFLEDTGDGEMFSVTSWEQGKYTVANGTVTEKKMPLSQFTRAIEKAVQR